MAAVRRLLAHRGSVTALVVLLALSTPLVWLGVSQGHFDPLLYSAVIEADVVFDTECNMVSLRNKSELGRQAHVTKLVEYLLDMPAMGTWCSEPAGEFTVRAKLWRTWLNLVTFSLHDTWEVTYESRFVPR